MSDIGAEVGLKMRSAIKAKLMELDCYVDDELPDYIMVMVANKRTKSQMKEDLTLFLNAKTTSFVDWLHIVLKKLKEVHVTNPDILKRSSKRNIDDSTETTKKIKKRKGSKSSKREQKGAESADFEPLEEKSLTDDLPITANKLTEVRKIVFMQNNATGNSMANKSDVVINEDMFDIPLLSEVDNLSNEEELKMIEKRINSVKNRLGIQVQTSSDSEGEKGNKSEDGDFLNLKADPEDIISGEVSTSSLTNIPSQRQTTIIEPATTAFTNVNNTEDRSHTPPAPVKTSINNNNNNDALLQKATTHSRIVFEDEPPKKQLYFSRQVMVDDDLPRKRSILDRLGKRSAEYNDTESRLNKVQRSTDRNKDDEIPKRRLRENEDRESEDRRKESKRKGSRSHMSDHDKHKEDVTHRTGVKSKVSIPDLPPKPPVQEESDSELEKKVKKKGVASVIKVKPRVIPPAAKQANKSLLLKAVAEAQRSIAQTPAVGSTKRDAIFTKTYKDKVLDQAKARKISSKEKSVLRNMLKAMVNSPLRKVTLEEDDLEYVPKPIKEQHVAVNIQYKPSPLKQLSVTSETSSENDVTTPTTTPQDINFKQQFIVTLDGIDAEQFSQARNASKEELPKRISPIVFDKVDNQDNFPKLDRSKIPDRLPIITIPSLKGRERCKFWPNCKARDKCEFHHPAIAAASASDGLCKMFPSCKFGDKCVYVHPVCKFENSCTRRDCPYSHKSAVPRVVPTPSICKYHPKCSNIHCSFYHPLSKPCKFGKYCNNQPDCIYRHPNAIVVPKPASLTWRSKT